MPMPVEEKTDYRYPHFHRRQLRHDQSFRSSPAPGEPMPEFDLMTVDGRRVSRNDLIGRPFLLSFASATCPMTISGIDALKRLHRLFRGEAEFLTVYVREAHPGDRIGQAQSFDEKMTRAAGFKQLYGIPWKVAVDDLDGTFHRRFDGHPNSVYLVDSNGQIAYRALWSGNEAGLRYGLEQLAHGRRGPIGEDRSRVLPWLAGVGVLDETLAAAGAQARRDVRHETPPLYAMGKLAGVFRPLPPLGRTLAALGLVAGVAGGIAALVIGANGRRSRS